MAVSDLKWVRAGDVVWESLNLKERHSFVVADIQTLVFKAALGPRPCPLSTHVDGSRLESPPGGG